MAWMQGHADDAAAHFERAIELHETQGNKAAAARAMNELAGVKARDAGFLRAIALCERALTLLSTADDGEDHEADIALVESRFGKLLYFHGDHDRALERTERALDIAEPAGLLEVFTYALDTKACILAARGRLDEAEILELAALRVALDRGLPSAAVIAGNAGATLEEKEQLETAMSVR